MARAVAGTRGAAIQPFFHVRKRPVGRCGLGVDLDRLDPGPVTVSTVGSATTASIARNDPLPVRPAVEQGTGDHVACRPVEWLENKDPHYQYL